MTQRINVNGHILEFPDGMSDAMMQAAIKSNGMEFAKQAPSLTDQAMTGAGNMLYGAAKGFADPVYGASQLLLHGANAAATAFGGGKTLQKITNDYDTFLKNGENQYQSDTDGSVMAGLGRFGANMVTPIKGAKGLTGLPALINGAKTGLGLATVQPVFDTDEGYASKKAAQLAIGGGMGAALPVLGNIAGAAWNSIRPAIKPSSTVGDSLLKATQADTGLGSSSAPALSATGKILQDIKTGLTGKLPQTPTDPTLNIGALNGNRNAQEVIDRINNRPNYVPGSNPTTAQVVNTPELSMAEKVLMNNPAYRVAMEGQANVNNQARISALGQVAKTPQELQSAIEARSTSTRPLYDEAFSKPYPITPELQAILDRPSAKAAIANGKVIAGEGNKELQITAGSPAKVSPTGLLDVSGMPLTKEIPAVAGSIDGQTLQYLKSGINNVIPDGRPNGIAGLSADAIKKTGGDLHNWLLENAPQYKAADAAYAAASKPINDMRVGQAINDVLGTSRSSNQLASTAEELAMNRKTLNTAGDTSLTLSNVQSAINKALSEEGHYGVTPGTAATLDGVKADLQRQSGGAAAVKSSGSDSVYNLQAPNWLSGKLFGADLSGEGNTMPAIVGGATMLGDVIGGMGIGSSLGLGALAATGAKKVGSFVGNRVNTEYQKAMSDPDYYAELLRRSMTNDGGLLNSFAPTVSNGLSVGGLLNTR